MKRTHSYSNDIKQATVGYLQSTDPFREIQDGSRRRLSPEVMNIARQMSHGAHRSTISLWMNTDIDLASEKKRLRKRGCKGTNPDLVKLAIGYAIHRRELLKKVSGSDIIDFVYACSGYKPTHQTISNWLKKHDFSTQLSVTRSSRLTTPTVAVEALEFIFELRERNLQPRQILVMDETGLWSNIVERRTYHFINLYEITNFLLFFHICLNLV
jgi:hypothetical protein